MKPSNQPLRLPGGGGVGAETLPLAFFGIAFWRVIPGPDK